MHNDEYRIYEVEQDLIDFLRGEGKHVNRSIYCIDKQVYSHYGEVRLHSDKYIGIVIDFQNQLYFAPLTHDGDRKWINREDTYDFEIIYDGLKKYAGSLLLCKALPLTHNLIKFKSIGQIIREEGQQYGFLCNDELKYLNSKLIHDKIQNKMKSCIYNKDSSCKEFRINYALAIKNVAEYNAMLLEQEKKKNEELQKALLEKKDNN